MMKLFSYTAATIIGFVLLVIFTNAPTSEIHTVSTPITGTIEGNVILSASNKTVRFGGGLYGRPTNPSTSVSSDSILVVLTGNSATELTTTDLEYLNQKNQQFQPSILPLRMGQTIRIQNSDPVYHNVFSLTSPHKFDVGRRPKGEHFDVTFEKPGIVDVFCDIHSNMRALVYVVPSNTLAWTKIKSGENFSFSNVPDGNYDIRIMALGYTEIVKPISVKSGDLTQIGTITLNM